MAGPNDTLGCPWLPLEQSYGSISGTHLQKLGSIFLPVEAFTRFAEVVSVPANSFVGFGSGGVQVQRHFGDDLRRRYQNSVAEMCITTYGGKTDGRKTSKLRHLQTD
jgi:hypothetical protein